MGCFHPFIQICPSALSYTFPCCVHLLSQVNSPCCPTLISQTSSVTQTTLSSLLSPAGPNLHPHWYGIRKICLPSFPQSIFHPNCSPNLILQTFQTKFPSPIKSLLIFMSPCNSQVFSVKMVPHTGCSLSLVLCINISGFDSCLGFRFRWHPPVERI